MSGPSSLQPERYDRPRVAHLQPLHDAVNGMDLPLVRLRKLRGILAALEMQIEDGGDSAEVNALLLDALRAALRQLGDGPQVTGAVQALDAFAQAEAARWAQVRAGTLPPMDLTPEEQLDDLMHEGYRLLEDQQTGAACDRWLEAWDLVTQLASPQMRTPAAFDRAHLLGQSVFNWCQDLEMELGNAGLADAVYHDHRLRYARAFLARFPDVDTLLWLNFMRAQGEALWRLGRQDEAEAVYAALVERLPTEGWAYIGWADQYWLERDSPMDFGSAEALLQRALRRPDLHDRRDVLERLGELYAAWGKPQEQAAVTATVAVTHDARRALPRASLVAPPTVPLGPPRQKPGRNAPCWCGSGRKYKVCHLEADRSLT